jgi:hypothetical protein
MRIRSSGTSRGFKASKESKVLKVSKESLAQLVRKDLEECKVRRGPKGLRARAVRKDRLAPRDPRGLLVRQGLPENRGHQVLPHQHRPCIHASRSSA